MQYFETYFKALQSHSLNDITEHSHRPALYDLLAHIAKASNPLIKILHEPKREGKFGSPDFKITFANSIIGYIENKKLDELLEKTRKSDQIKKYKELRDNILLTNYRDFMWIKGDEIKVASLFYPHELESRKTKLTKENCENVEQLLHGFFSQPPKQIANAKKLAEALAVRAKHLKEFLLDELTRQEKEHKEGKLSGLYETFKTFIFHELELTEFADAFAQNLVYGLFLAKLNADTKKIDLANAKSFIPGSFELIRELVDFLDELDKPEYSPVRWIVEEVLTILNHLDLPEIQRSLFYRSSKKTDLFGDTEYDFKDPFIYFYEYFLSVYDKKLRKAKGVYYTPPPIVNFIVRAIDDIIINTFGYKDGLANHEKVTVLDFATGTGTFLLDVFKQVLNKVPKASSRRQLIIKEHLLKNMYGFEYLIAPYTIAHLKLSQYLKEEGYNMKADERLNVFLTNTLEPVDKQIRIPLLPALSEETRNAQKVKDSSILVITGNPPYFGHSRNNSPWILDKIKVYYKIDGKRLEEKNTKWLRDDYVKFIRFAQDKIEQVETGIVGIITNHRFLSNPTFPGMRKSLLDTFDQIHIIDLHGSNKPKELAPDGGIDENVFDGIQQGVSISIFVKKKGIEKKIFYSDMWGKSNDKYDRCWESQLNDIPWQELQPSKPFYLFKPQDISKKADYEKGLQIKDIFKNYGNGIVTKRDKLVIDIDKVKLIQKLEKFQDIAKSDDYVKEYFNLPLKDKDKWDMRKSRMHIQKTGILYENIVPINYRPFDMQWLYFDDILVARLVKGIMSNLRDDNLGLIIGRAGQNVKGNSWELCFMSLSPIDLNIFSRGGGTVFPLLNFQNNSSQENFHPTFRKYIDTFYKNHFTPEQILGYIYAILHSPTYRSKYAEFLKIDFPRIPFTKDKKVFEELSGLGTALINIHLLKTASNLPNHELMGHGSDVIEKPMWSGGKLYINKTRYFEDVSKEVYEFYIGGYQVADKWLKDRKGKMLSLIELELYSKIINALQFTINQMKFLDKKTKSWV